MIKKIKETFKPEYMLRPVIYKAFSRFIMSLVICMAWFRFIDKGARGLGFVFQAMALLFFIFVWFTYLNIDGVRVGHLMMDWKKKKRPKTVHFNKDIADFIDEEVVDYDELEDDEKVVVRFFSNLIVAVIYTVLAFIF